MADTYTTNLNLTKPEPGAAEDTWGISLNADLDALDAIFSSSGTQINLNPNQVNFADNKKAVFGAGSDLQIYHDGSTSYILDDGTGDLQLRTNNRIVLAKSPFEYMADFNADGAVDLYYDNSKKLATTSSGIDVTGTVVSDALKIVDSTTSNISLMEDGSSGADIKYIGSNNNFVIATGTGGAGSQTQRLSIQRDTGDISFYDDTGSTQGLFWDSSAESLGIGTTSPSGTLHVKNSTGSSLVLDATITGSSLTSLAFQRSSTNKWRILQQSNDSHLLFYNDVNGINQLSLKADGNVGIGETSPDGKLHIKGGTATGDASHVLFENTQGSKVFAIGGGASGVTNNNLYIRNVTDNTTPMVITDAGNVGVGTNSPARTAVINSSGTSTLQITNDTTGVTTTDGLQIKHYTSGATQIWNYESSYMAFGTNNLERARITSDGSVGIGTSSPTRNLTVHGGSGNSIFALQNNSTGSAAGDGFQIQLVGKDIYQYNYDDGFMAFGTNNAERLRLISNGNFGIGTDSPGEKLTVGGNTLTYGSTGNVGAGASYFLGNSQNSRDIALTRVGSATLAIGYYSSGWQESARFDSSGNFGIGTSSPSLRLHSKDTGNYQLDLDSGGTRWRMGAGWSGFHQNSFLLADTANGIRMAIDTSGKVGIGTTSPSSTLEVNAPASNGIKISSTAPYLFFNDTDTAHNYDGSISQSGTTLYVGGATPAQGIVFRNKASFGESARFDTLGNLLVGTTSIAPYASTSSTAQGISLRGDLGFIGVSRPNNSSAYFNRAGNDGSIIDLRKSGLSIGTIGAKGGDLTIQSSTSNHKGLRFGDANISPTDNNGNVQDATTSLGTSSVRFKDLHLSGTANVGGVTLTGTGTDNDSHILSFVNGACAIARDNNDLELHAYNAMVFGVSNTAYPTSVERARIDTSGNLLVGTTNTFPPSDTGNEGVAVKPDNIAISRNASTPLFLDRMTSDGVLIDLRKDNNTGGVIGIQEPQDDAPEFYIANGTGSNTVGLAFWDYIQTARIAPCNGLGAYKDNYIDLGYSGARFDDIYATNGTIQTSDRNDKQDIQALTDAETRVATACKGLLRRFRWQDAVTEKGDEARLHFGVIAQDLQDAFTAEGLDAGDYGMFISSTWTDDDGNEQTRLGVRYNELLAFIITTL